MNTEINQILKTGGFAEVQLTVTGSLFEDEQGRQRSQPVLNFTTVKGKPRKALSVRKFKTQLMQKQLQVEAANQRRVATYETAKHWGFGRSPSTQVTRQLRDEVVRLAISVNGEALHGIDVIKQEVVTAIEG